MPIRTLLPFAIAWIVFATPVAARDPIARLGAVPADAIVTVARDGERAAIALPPEKDRTLIRWSGDGSDACESIELPGQVRDLTYVTAESTLFALQHKPGKKGLGETHLTRIDLLNCRFKRELLMPESSSGLTHWPDEDALLVSARDEVRTVRLPTLRSGPLFRIPGANLKIEVLEGSRILVGQAEQTLLIDLSDPPTRESMPIRRTWNLSAPVASIETGQPAGSLSITTDDGRFTETDPLAPTPEPTAEPKPAPVAPVEEILAAAPAEPEVRKEPEPPVAHHQMSGRILGEAADSVVAVVLSGPDNLLREAARVPVGDHGRWFVDDMADGRYRIQLDGGGGRVIVSDPPFLILDVQGDTAIEAPSIHAVRIL